MAEISTWEYRSDTIGSFWSEPKNDAMEALLNEWGEEGWEVISVVAIQNSNKLRIIAKRPSTQTSRRRRSWPAG
jgi:hypothetical protein